MQVSTSTLTQEAIDRAFSSSQRRSRLVYTYEEYSIVVINGKHTDRLEVAPLAGFGSEILDVTKVERTLIDIVVRPAYAGGLYHVLEVFKRARAIASSNTIVAVLKKLDYTYPYHQAVGFYMERAGYSEQAWSRLLNIGVSYDFYLAHGLPDSKRYDSKWRLYYPPEIDLAD